MMIYVYADRVSVNYVASAMCLDMFLCYILQVLGSFFFRENWFVFIYMDYGGWKLCNLVIINIKMAGNVEYVVSMCKSVLDRLLIFEEIDQWIWQCAFYNQGYYTVQFKIQAYECFQEKEDKLFVKVFVLKGEHSQYVCCGQL